VSGFFYFIGVKAKQVARKGFSDEMKLCLNLNEVKFVESIILIIPKLSVF